MLKDCACLNMPRFKHKEQLTTPVMRMSAYHYFMLHWLQHPPPLDFLFILVSWYQTSLNLTLPLLLKFHFYVFFFIFCCFCLFKKNSTNLCWLLISFYRKEYKFLWLFYYLIVSFGNWPGRLLSPFLDSFPSASLFSLTEH